MSSTGKRGEQKLASKEVMELKRGGVASNVMKQSRQTRSSAAATRDSESGSQHESQHRAERTEVVGVPSGTAVAVQGYEDSLNDPPLLQTQKSHDDVDDDQEDLDDHDDHEDDDERSPQSEIPRNSDVLTKVVLKRC